MARKVKIKRKDLEALHEIAYGWAPFEPEIEKLLGRVADALDKASG